MKNKSPSFVQQLIHLLLGSGLGLLIGVITTPTITRLVDPEIYGQFSVFKTYISVAMCFLTLGLDQFFMRYYYVNRETAYRRKLFFITAGIPLLCLVVLSAVSFLVVFFLKNAGFAIPYHLFLLSVLTLIIAVIDRFLLVLLRLQKKTKAYSALNVVQRLAYLAISVSAVLLLSDNHLVALVLANAIAPLITAICAARMVISFIRPQKSNIKLGITLKEMVRFSFPVMIAGSVMHVFQALDRLCLNAFTTYEVVGVYASAQSLMSVFSVIQTTFTTVWMPKAIEHYETDSEDKQFYKRVNGIITVVMYLFAATVLIGKDLFVLLLGEKYRKAAEIIPFLMFNPIMYTISETTVMGIFFKKKTGSQVYISTLSALVNLILNLTLIPVLGAKGAAISTGVAYIMFFTLRTWIAERHYKVGFDLKHFYIVTGLFVLNATYSMYRGVDAMGLAINVLFIVCVCLLYRKYVSDILRLCTSSIKRILKLRIGESNDG